MNYFVIQVKTNGEEKFLQHCREFLYYKNITIHWTRRRLTIRKQGKRKSTLASLFPGYLFLELDQDTVPNDIYWRIKKTPGFTRFLKNNHDIQPLNENDKKLLLHFLSFGEIVEKSKVVFDENSRIRVVEGPMIGLEGKIVRVDKRKGRAKIQLEMYDNSFFIDLGFEILEKIPQDNKQKVSNKKASS